MSLNERELNENQKKAVHCGDGPFLVLAGPGSGKTGVLTSRIKTIINETSGKQFKVLGLTFTNKAATEMKKRIKDSENRTRISTFHAFAIHILKEHGHHIGLDNFELKIGGDRFRALNDAMGDIRLPENIDKEKMLNLIDSFIGMRITSQEILNRQNPEVLNILRDSRISDTNITKVGEIYGKYIKYMADKKFVDFSIAMNKAIEILEKSEDVKKEIQGIYKYICVDEFQDTNFSQYLLLKNIVDKNTKNLFVVADYDQLIYEWNGASLDRFDELKKDYNVSIIELNENYRCSQPIVAASNKLISHNERRYKEAELISKKSLSTNSVEIIRMKEFDDFDKELEWVSNDMLAKMERGDTGFAVLARRNEIVDLAFSHLKSKGIDCYKGKSKDEFGSIPLLWLVSILRLANDRGNREYFETAYEVFFLLEKIDIDSSDIISDDASPDKDYLRIWYDAVLSHAELIPETKSIIKKSVGGLLERLNPIPFISDAIELLDSIESSSNDVFGEYSHDKKEFDGIVAKIQKKFGKDIELHTFLQELDNITGGAWGTPPEKRIPCYTIHASKGMEFKHVYLIALVERELPVWSNEDIEAERRVCFVAITRGEETLTLTYSKKFEKWKRSPSRFLKEMGD